MRLSLPSAIKGIKVKRIIAIDCSDTANKVYEENLQCQGLNEAKAMTAPADEEIRSHLWPISVRPPLAFDVDDSIVTVTMLQVNGLKIEDVDGVADIWTMSPPCQPCNAIHTMIHAVTA